MTVAHINATAKNAADDKLRQSLRRFADTHTAPATVVLVSSECLWGLSTARIQFLSSVALLHVLLFCFPGVVFGIGFNGVAQEFLMMSVAVREKQGQ